MSLKDADGILDIITKTSKVLHLCCVINVRIWFSHDLRITGLNHFVPLSKKSVVMSSLETDIENPSELS